VVEEALFAGQAKLARREAAEAEGEDDTAGAQLAAGGAQPELPLLAADMLHGLVVGQLGAEAACLIGQQAGEPARCQLRLGGEVGHRLGGIEIHQLPAEVPGLQDHCGEPAQLRVCRRGQTGRTAADDGDIIGIHRFLHSSNEEDCAPH